MASAGACLLLALLVTLGVVTAGQTAGPHVQGHVRLHPSWHMHSLSTHRYAQVQGSSSSSQGRSLQQAQPAVPNALPKYVRGCITSYEHVSVQIISSTCCWACWVSCYLHLRPAQVYSC